MPRRASASVDRGSVRSTARAKAAPKAGPTSRAAPATPTDGQILRDGLGLPPERNPHVRATTYVGFSGEVPAAAWGAPPPQVVEPPTPLDPSDHPPVEVTANELSPAPPAKRRLPGEAELGSELPLTAQALRSELRAANRLNSSEQRLYARLPTLNQIPNTYQLVDGFLQGLEKEAKTAAWTGDLLDLAFSQMAVHVQMHYTDLLDKRFPQSEHTYSNLVTVMIGSVAAEQPEHYLARALKDMKLPDRAAWSIYAEVRRVHRAYESLCKRLSATPSNLALLAVSLATGTRLKGNS